MIILCSFRILEEMESNLHIVHIFSTWLGSFNHHVGKLLSPMNPMGWPTTPKVDIVAVVVEVVVVISLVLVVVVDMVVVVVDHQVRVGLFGRMTFMWNLGKL